MPRYLPFPTLSLALLLACASSSAQQLQSALDVGQPGQWDADLALPQVVDINPDPAILEFNLDAAIHEMEIIPGKLTPVWSYNGGLPGPLIKAKVGDRIIVHFKNMLPAATSIHWHGMRLPNDMDGVPGFTQDEVAANGGEFTYDFIARDAGTFWYHPHVNSAAQVGWGLYGPILITDPHDDPGYGDDLVLLLSDMSLDEDGQFLSPDSGGAFGVLFGHEGNILLVNGKVMPTLKVRQGKQQRWRVINAARSRYYTLRYKRAPLVLLGGDGGLATRTRMVSEVKLVPSERADFVFTPPDEPGSQGVLRWYPTDRGYGSTFNRFSETMMNILTVADAPVKPLEFEPVLRNIAPIDISAANQRMIDLTIAFDRDDKVVMGINGIAHEHAKALEVKVGQSEVWTVRNDTDFAHPFHLHGYFFQVLDDSGVLAWKDTVDVPSKTEVKLAVQFDERPGMWMYHCHILDHAEAGMMGHLHVMP